MTVGPPNCLCLRPSLWNAGNRYALPWLGRSEFVGLVLRSAAALFGADRHRLRRDSPRNFWQRHQWLGETPGHQVPFVVRIAVFVGLVAFGYGAASLMIAHLLGRVLMQLDNRYVAVVVLVSFVGLGVLAEHKGHI